MNLQSEPVRIFALLAGLFVAVGSALIDVGAGIDVATAIGKAVVAFGVVVGGGELGRSKAYSPEKAEDIMEADTFLRGRGA